MQDLTLARRRWSLLGFVLVLLLTWFCYRPALGGAFLFDDLHNLGGLAQIDDSKSFVNYVFSGVAGPLGRPIALWSFAMQADHWEEGARAFLLVNVLIHIVNAALLAWCLYELALCRSVEKRGATFVAASAASLWVLLPLLAPASLMVVQRMTTLSALFSLLGLASYLMLRIRLADMPGKALIGMSASLVVATGLAALAKESGLLLPVFVLVLEATVLERPTAIDVRRWRAWRAVFLLLPTLAILAYLTTRVSYPDWLIARRDFNAWERLLTEAHILWLYIFKAFVVLPGQLGVFHDGYPIARSLLQPLTFLACGAWVATIVAALVWRRRYPLFALAVFWYLAGHVFESTVIPLELYFEHRNYMPLIGPVFALCSFMFLGSDQMRRAGMIIVPAALFLNAYFLFSFASLLGEPSVAARYWAITNPTSVRAVSILAAFQQAEEGPTPALNTIDRFTVENPRFAYLKIAELNILCMAVPDQDHRQLVADTGKLLARVDFSYTAGKMLSQLSDTAALGECQGVTLDTVVQLANQLHSNWRYVDDPLYNRFHHKLMAGIARRSGDYATTVDNLEKAIALGMSTELNMMMATTLSGAGNFDAAYAFLDSAEAGKPWNPLRAFVWRRKLEELRTYVRELEKLSSDTTIDDSVPGVEPEQS